MSKFSEAAQRAKEFLTSAMPGAGQEWKAPAAAPAAANEIQPAPVQQAAEPVQAAQPMQGRMAAEPAAAPQAAASVREAAAAAANATANVRAPEAAASMPAARQAQNAPAQQPEAQPANDRPAAPSQPAEQQAAQTPVSAAADNAMKGWSYFPASSFQGNPETDIGHMPAPRPSEAEAVQAAADQIGQNDTDAVEDAIDATIDRRFRDSQIASAGNVGKSNGLRGLSRLNRAFLDAKKATVSKIKGIFSNMNRAEGMVINGVLYSDCNLAPNCISVGLDMAVDALLDVEGGFLALVNDATMISLGYTRSAEEYLANPELLMDDVNKCDISVTAEKSPVNIRNSVQVRRLKIHHGGGIGLHPTQAKAFNADFDADQMTVNMDQANTRHYNRAMDYLLDAEGLPAVDMDFFPIEPLNGVSQDELKATIKDWYFKMNPDGTSPVKGLTQVDLDAIADKVSGSYWLLCDSLSDAGARSKDEAKKEFQNRTIALFRQIDRIANEYSDPVAGRYRNELSSYIFQELFNFSRVRRALSVKAQVSDIVGADVFLETEGVQSPLTEALVDYVNSVVAGRAPFSMIEFGEFMNKQMGTVAVEGRNVPFRLVADFCKAVHRTDLINIGDPMYGVTGLKGYGPEDPVPFNVLYGITCAAAETKLLANRVYLGSHELSVSRQVRERVVSELAKAGFPGGLANYVGCENQTQRDEAFRTWLYAFIDSYNRNVRLYNMSQIELRNGMTIAARQLSYIERTEHGTTRHIPRGDGIADIDRDLAKPLVEVFGDKTMSAVFGYDYTKFSEGYPGFDNSTDTELWLGYRDMPVRVFMHKNRLKFTSTNGIKNRQARASRGQVTVRDVIMLVADRRTKQLGQFAREWKKATQQNAELFASLAKHRNSRDFGKYLQEVVEIFSVMSPEMFSFFGLDSVSKFLGSDHGKRLMAFASRRDVDGMRGEIVSMLVEMRLHRASKLIDGINELERKMYLGEVPTQTVEARRSTLEREYAKLGEASHAWHAIIADVQVGAENSTFRKLIENKGLSAEAMKNMGIQSLFGDKFWKDPASDKYATILTFLKASDVGYETKMAVLADVVRINERMRDYGPDHMIGLLALDPDSMSDNSSYELDLGIKGQIESAKASVDKISSYRNKMPDEIAEESRAFVQAIRYDIAGFEKWLGRMAGEKGFSVYVPQIVAADAMASVFEKNMHDTEKIQQQAQVNGLFENVSIQVNGGFFTHFQQTDNKVVNVVGYNQVTFMDLVKILSDPDLELWLYDEFGAMMDEPLCRKTLCGGDDIQSVVSYLENNPRISCLLRRYAGGVNADLSGSAAFSRMGYMSNASSMTETVGDQVWGLMTDRPRFYAVCAFLADPMGNIGRNMSERFRQSIEWTCLELVEIAMDQKMSVEDNIELRIDHDFGLSKDRIKELLMSGGIPGIGFCARDADTVDEDAGILYDMIHSELVEALGLVENSGVLDNLGDNPASIIRVIVSSKAAIGFSPSMSKLSIRAGIDVLQQISGARTQKMLDIEGAETKRNFALKIWARHHQDRYAMRTNQETGRMEPQVVEPGPAGTFEPDDTLSHNVYTALTSIAKFLELKREKAAEIFNAKTKKFGDDGKNSIVKFLKYDDGSVETGKDFRATVAEANRALLEDYQDIDRESLVRQLAALLIKADKDLGYTDIGTNKFKESDYFNRADVMLGTNSDGTIVIRTLEQISTALASRMPDELIYAKPTEDNKQRQIDFMNKIVEDLGTDRDTMARSASSIAYDCLIDIPIKGGLSEWNVNSRRAQRSRSSSVERSYAKMWDIARKYSNEVLGGKAFMPPARAQIEARANAVRKSMGAKGSIFSDTDVAKLQGIGFPKDCYDPKAKTESKMVPGYDFSKTYDLIGTSETQPSGGYFVPGPQSLVVFKSGVNEKPGAYQLFKMCCDYGVTVCFMQQPNDDDVDDPNYKFSSDLVQIQVGDEYCWLLPTFDMMINGSASKPIAPAPAQFLANRSNMVTSVKDTTGEFGPGDAVYSATKELIDRAYFAFRGKKPEMFRAHDLFKNTMDTYGARDYRISFANMYDVENHIASGKATIDLGVSESDVEAFAKAQRKYSMLEDEYFRRVRTGQVEEDTSVLLDECRHNSIVGYAKLMFDDKIVFAPIIPFPPERSGLRPNHYKVTSKDYDATEGSFAIGWEYSGSIADQIIKIFEGIGASNKFMVSRNLARSRALKSGWAIDGFYYHESIASRLFSSNERIHTMISLWTMAKLDPEFSYNFALVPGSFPDCPPLKDALADNRLTREDWADIVKNGTYQGVAVGRYFADNDEKGARINSLVKHFVEKAVGFGTVNPSILLCSRTRDELLPPWMTEFETFLDSSYAFEDTFLSFFNLMQPKLCPDGIEGDAKACLFKPELRDNGLDPYGTLLCLVPHWLPDVSEPYEALEAVFISPSFFGEEYSDFKNITVDAKNRFMDSLNVANDVTPREQSLLLEAARASMSGVPTNAPGGMTMSEESQTRMTEAVDEIMPKMLDGLDYELVATAEDSEAKIHQDILHSRGDYGKIVAVAGHRPKAGLWGFVKNDPTLLSNMKYKEVYDKFKKYCEDNNVGTVISGMAQGFDQIAAQVAIDLKKEGHDVMLVAAVPFFGQEEAWYDPKAQDYYRDILTQADEIYVIRDGGYKPSKMQDRNMWMVDNADEVFSLFDESKDDGGTFNCVQYAAKVGKKRTNLDPRSVTGKPAQPAKDTESGPVSKADQERGAVINPVEDGTGHVNVWSRGETDLGRFLSNFYETLLDLPDYNDGGKVSTFASIEAYWQAERLSEKCPPEERAKLAKMSGSHAQSYGRALRKKYGESEHPEYLVPAVSDAVWNKLDKYRKMWIDDPHADLPLMHYFVSGGKAADQSAGQEWWLDALRNGMDHYLQERRRGND